MVEVQFNCLAWRISSSHRSMRCRCMWEMRRDLLGRFQPERVNCRKGTGQDPLLPLPASNPSTHRKRGEILSRLSSCHTFRIKNFINHWGVQRSCKSDSVRASTGLTLMQLWIHWLQMRYPKLHMQEESSSYMLQFSSSQPAASANLSRSPEIALACVAEPLQKKVRMKAIFFSHYTLHKL